MGANKKAKRAAKKRVKRAAKKRARVAASKRVKPSATFEDLPPELRQQIFAYALSVDDELHEPYFATDGRDGRLGFFKSSKRVSIGAVFIKRAWRNEAMDILFRTNDFAFTNPWSMYRFAEDVWHWCPDFDPIIPNIELAVNTFATREVDAMHAIFGEEGGLGAIFPGLRSFMVEFKIASGRGVPGYMDAYHLRADKSKSRQAFASVAKLLQECVCVESAYVWGLISDLAEQRIEEKMKQPVNFEAYWKYMEDPEEVRCPTYDPPEEFFPSKENEDAYVAANRPSYQQWLAAKSLKAHGN